MATTDTYNIETYYRDINDAARAAFPSSSPRVGEPAPPFRLPLVGGGTVDLTQMRSGGSVVLVFGCFTAPPAMAQLPALESLHRTYGGRGFSFLFIYTREIHPGENFSPHRTMEQKLDQATRMKDYARITFPVAADDLEGTVHRAYGNLPSMACIVHRDGSLIYRGSWTDADVIREVLENQLLREQSEGSSQRGRVGYHEWIKHMAHETDDHWKILDIAGPKSRADYERANAIPRS
jgi:AhpC/TSA family